VILAGLPGRLLQLDARSGAEIAACDVGGSPRGLAWRDGAIYVGLLQGQLLRLEADPPR
jgi:hypothetical protein